MPQEFITSELLKEDPSLIDLIDKFLSRLTGMHEAIMKAHNDKEWETFLSLIHQMKGVGGNYGYPAVTILCEEIEADAKKHNYSDVEHNLSEFKLMCEKILAGSEENHKFINIKKG